MGVITVLNGGHPWLICNPVDQDDLDRFLSASAAHAVGSGFSSRTAAQTELRRWTAACMLHVRAGGDLDKFFGIPA